MRGERVPPGTYILRVEVDADARSNVRTKIMRLAHVVVLRRRGGPPSPTIDSYLGAWLVYGCQSEPPPVYFTDATDQAGLSFVHENGAAGQYFLIETMGAGGALADFDEDGDLDIYLVNGFDLRGLDAPPINLVHREDGLYWVAPSAPSAADRSADPADYAVALAP